MAQTIEQFGQTIKAKYPQYQDMPDAELGTKMLAKYPQYQDMVETTPTKIDKPGFFQGLVQSVAKAPLTMATTIGKAIGATGALAGAGLQYATGKKEEAKKTLGIAEKIASYEPVDYGYFGKIRPMGVTETGGKLGIGGQIKQATGIGAELASYGIGGPAAKGAVGTIGQALKTGIIKPVIKGVAKESAIIGGTSALGTSLQEQAGSKESVLKQAGEVAKSTAVGAGAGAILAPAIGAPILGGKALIKGAVSKAEKSVATGVDKFIASKPAVEKAIKVFETKKYTPITEMMKDKNIYEGLKVEGMKINPDKAIEVAQHRIDRGMDVVKDLMPEIDKYAGKTGKQQVREGAVKYINDQNILQADKDDIIKAIDSQLSAQPNEFLPSQLDAVRAQARGSARTAKGILKRDTEYAALETATRDLLFAQADKLPMAQGGEFAELRDLVKQNINLVDFLDNKLRGQVVTGGKLGTYTGRIIGGLAASPGGIFGTIVGQEVGGRIADILTNNQLGSNVKIKLIRKITDNPKALVEAEKLLASQQGFKQLLLPAPSSIKMGPAPLGRQK